MEAFEKSRISAFLDRITACFPVGEPIASIVITHLLAERPCFLDAVNSIVRSVPYCRSRNRFARTCTPMSVNAFRSIASAERCSPIPRRPLST